jgi:hypothetical protein
MQLFEGMVLSHCARGAINMFMDFGSLFSGGMIFPLGFGFSGLFYKLK